MSDYTYDNKISIDDQIKGKSVLSSACLYIYENCLNKKARLYLHG
jgi:hypothetical protein